MPVDTQPKTWDIAIGGNARETFKRRERDPAYLRRLGLMYDQGGMVSEAIDSYALYALTNGYTVISDDENLAKHVGEWLKTWAFEECAFRLITDALVYKYGIQEILPDRAGKPHSLKPCPSWTMDLIRDEYGRVLAIKQYKDDGLFSKEQSIDPASLIVFEWIWLMHRAFDDIERDTKTADGISTAIERHGFPRYHIAVGAPGEKPGGGVVEKIARRFSELKPNMEIATVADVKITNVDQGGAQNSGIYNNLMVQRLCSAIGVPEEILGLGRGSTEATANVRLQAFYDKISTLQRAVSRAYQPLLDRYTGKPGATTLRFNDVSPVDENMKMDFLVKVATINRADPEYIMTRDEMRAYMGWEPLATEPAEPPEVIRDER